MQAHIPCAAPMRTAPSASRWTLPPAWAHASFRSGRRRDHSNTTTTPIASGFKFQKAATIAAKGCVTRCIIGGASQKRQSASVVPSIHAWPEHMHQISTEASCLELETSESRGVQVGYPKWHAHLCRRPASLLAPQILLKRTIS